MLRYFLSAILLLVLFVFLTVTTQVGGVVLVGGWLFFRYLVFRRAKSAVVKALASTGGLYLLACFVAIPLLAQLGGRTALPVFATESNPLAPRNLLYCLMNRHYVDAKLADTAKEAAAEMGRAYPGTTVHYLDACFPFVDGFPLLPHLTHRDGLKLDFCLFYHKEGRPEEYVDSPSPIGYWIYEAPERGEPAPYSDRDCFLRWDFPFLQGLRQDRSFDRDRTRHFVKTLLAQRETEKILLELHLQRRIGLSAHPRLRFQQCNAARHDDHLHLQVYRR